MRNKKRKREAEEKRTQEEKETYKAYSIVEKKGGVYKGKQAQDMEVGFETTI